MSAAPRMLIAVLFLLPMQVSASDPSPYAGEEAREIKALSAKNQADRLAGRGMGYAIAAELNGYPGPAHVLELASELELTPDQKSKTERLFESMGEQAKALGRQLVQAERELDSLFISKKISRRDLAAYTGKIGALEAGIRSVHLEAHLEQVKMLTPGQTKRYMELRGYGAGKTAHHHGKH